MEPLSIDSVVVDTPLAMTPTSPTTLRSEAIPIAPPKLKGRQRLLHGLQRMSSSPSLAGLGRTRSQSLRSNGKASMSCVSLASSGSPYGQSYGSSYSSEMSAGYSTAPTSVANSPGPASPIFDDKTRLRVIGADAPTSVALPADLRPMSRDGVDVEGDYFSHQVRKKIQRRANFNFWGDMPPEIRMHILRYLKPKEIVRCSAVSKSWHAMCFDGQLWSDLDTSEYYRDITAPALVNIITSAGPFVRDLNLRGCVQLREQWSRNGLIDACRNIENFSLEGCRIDRTSIHCFLLKNSRLIHVNLSGLAGATNATMKILASNCPKVEHLNISWCNNVDTRGLRKVVEGCLNLRDLRAGEVRGFDDIEFMFELFKRNTLDRLVLMNCDSLNDDSLAALVEGVDSEVDVLTDRPIVPPRRLKHLDLTRCRGISDNGVETLAGNVPFLEGLQLSKCHTLTDSSLITLLPTCPVLTHLDLEELDGLTNEVLKTLAATPCAPHLQHLCISYCENLGDSGMLPVLKSCSNITSLDMDNTRISDLVLAEAASSIRARNRGARKLSGSERPHVGLKIVAYDCANVTWTGVREVLSRNAEISRPSANSLSTTPTYPREIIGLKCFYNWQPTVEEHTKRVLRGDFAAAGRLERKWADWMMLNEEAGMGGTGARRRRRRAREAQLLHADEEEGGAGGGVGGVGRRRRARSGPGGCTVMSLACHQASTTSPTSSPQKKRLQYYARRALYPHPTLPLSSFLLFSQIPSQRWIALSHRRLQAHPSTLTTNNTLLGAPLPSYLVKPVVERFKTLGVFENTLHGAPNHVLINEYKRGEGIMPHEDGSAYAKVVATVSLGGSICLDITHKPTSGREGEEGESGEEMGTDCGALGKNKDTHEEAKGKSDSKGTPKLPSQIPTLQYKVPTRILQEPRSLLITTSSAYTDLLHGISPIEIDENLSPDTVANWYLLAEPHRFEEAGGRNERATRVSLTYRDVLKVSSAAGKVFGPLGNR
ncbi:RNI-like protein [Lindgomyces ingoldianus]|uniref:RNI-like protein n=1 Tax=Lindgomyces ingoldianus TaxID=673940 RepID=A0ACB6Q899_9PLEO|nr:RNI-like protein [Lindgomyces ingoldianus]KAF2463244.1 RNI-like protein [Lindgomyces ingoldianus]